MIFGVILCPGYLLFSFSDDAQRVTEALAAKTFLMLRIAKIRAGEAKANAIKELLILMAHFTPILLPS